MKNLYTSLLFTIVSIIILSGCTQEKSESNLRQSVVDGPNAYGLTATHENSSVLTEPVAGAPIELGNIVFSWTRHESVQAIFLGVGDSEASVSASPWGTYYIATVSGNTVTIENLVPNGKPLFVRLWTRIAGVWYSTLYEFATLATTNSIAQQIAALEEKATKSDQKLQSVEGSVGAIATTLQTAIEDQKTQQSNVLDAIADLKTFTGDKFDLVDTALGRIENKVLDVKNQINTKTSSLMTILLEVSEGVLENATAIDKVQQNVDDLATDLNNLSYSVMDLQFQIDEIEALLSLVDSTLLDLEYDVFERALDMQDQLNSILDSLSDVETTVNLTKARVDVRADDLEDDIFVVQQDVLHALDDIHALLNSGGGGGSNQGEGAIRLTSGYLEIQHNSEWRGVCDDSFNTDAATVACRQLGRPFSNATFQSTSGSGSFWLDDVNCAGSEYSLGECAHSAWGVHNCNTSEHVMLLCN